MIFYPISTFNCTCASSEPFQVGYSTFVHFGTEKNGGISLTIRLSSHLSAGAPRPFNLSVSTVDGTASMCDINLSHSIILMFYTHYRGK